MAIGPRNTLMTVDPRSGGHLARLDQQPLRPPAYKMSYQQYGPPSTSADVGMSSSAYAPAYDGPSATGSGSVGDTNWPYQRSFSTPEVKSLHQDASDPLQLGGAERRRNKLGYHRTSVACNHCRKRKIRCMPSNHDLQGRCASCIRLKKDCSFVPPDHPPMPELHAKEPSQGYADPKIASSSSPSPASGDDQSGHHALSRSSGRPSTGLATADGHDMHNSPSSGARSSQPYEFSPTSVPSTIPSDLGSYHEPKPLLYGDKPRPSQPGISPFYGSYNNGHHISSNYPSTDPLHSRGSAWGSMGPPVRSMSYGGPNGHAPYLPIGGVDHGYQSGIEAGAPLASNGISSHSSGIWPQRQSRGYQHDGPSYGR